MAFDFDTTLTLRNYETAVEEPVYGTLLWRSILISATCSIATVLLSYPMAYYVAFHVKRYKMFWIILMTLPFWTSYLLRVFAWKVILGFNGVINSGLKSVGFIEQPMEFLLYSPTAVVITLAHAWAAFAVLPLYVSLEKIDRSLLEAATDLGAGPVERFLRVTLPLSLPGVIAAVLIIFIPTVGDYITPALLGGPDGIMLANLIQAQFGKVNDWPMGAALAVSMMITVAVFSIAVHHYDTANQGADRVKDVSYIDRPNRPLAVYAILYLAFLYVPVMFLPLFSFNDSIYIAFPLKDFTTKWYGELFQNEPMFAALMNSLKVGGVAAVALDPARYVRGQGRDALSPSRARAGGQFYYAPASYTGNHFRCRTVDPDEPARRSALALHGDTGARHRLRSVCHGDPHSQVRGVRQVDRGGFGRPRREYVRDVLARHAANRVPGRRRQSAALLHDLVR